ncbi:MAG: hypothetical protein J5I52_04470 [Saprospiraceae bacterium]|nr:hypothetical protein [Saprospiraceae bacterium]
MFAPTLSGLQKTTNYKVVIPFYIYAAVSFLVSTILLLVHTGIVNSHYFNPYTLAITHTMALGWGTMIIMGASHQLLPVLIEGELDSDNLAYSTFAVTGVGIPLLITGFYVFDFGVLMLSGASLINLGVLLYIVNVYRSAFKSKVRNVHAWFIMTAALWLLATTFFGLLLVYNMNTHIFPESSVAYLSLHAHLGLVGWFLLLITGVGSRLIPMFLISKYSNKNLLWWVYGMINGALVSFILFKIAGLTSIAFLLSIIAGLTGILLFGVYCYKAYKVRIRRQVDDQMKISLLSVAQMLIPLIAIILILYFLPAGEYLNISILYGFCILFGWITAIILGMTFKTLPFIVWNKVYTKKAFKGRTPTPKELFSDKIYSGMLIAYLSGFVLFIAGILLSQDIILKVGAFALLLAAVLYVTNTGKIITHQQKQL